MNLLDLQDEKFKTVTVKGHKFKIRYISPLDKVQISQRRMSLQGGNPVESLTEDDFNFFNSIAMCDVCIEESPDDFDENTSCINWDDEELVYGVALEIQKHTNNIKAKLKKNKPVIGGEQT